MNTFGEILCEGGAPLIRVPVQAQGERRGGKRNRVRLKCYTVALTMEEGAMSQGIQIPPEAGKGKEVHSPLQPLQRLAVPTFDFSPVKSVSDF